jgi:hypothetical protein
MKTQIDNGQKVFQLVGDMGRQVFCNLSDIPKALKSFDDKDAVEFFYFWNNRPKKISRRKLNDWFKTNGVNAKFNF